MNIERLAQRIYQYIRQNFETLHYSTNLMETLVLRKTEDGYELEIPARIYDKDVYDDTGAIVYTNEGSYAQDVNIYGGLSARNGLAKGHKHYIEEAIQWAIEDELQVSGEKGDVKVE